VTSYKLHSNTLPLQDIKIDEVLPWLLQQTVSTRTNLKKNLKQTTPLAKK